MALILQSIELTIEDGLFVGLSYRHLLLVELLGWRLDSHGDVDDYNEAELARTVVGKLATQTSCVNSMIEAQALKEKEGPIAK